MTTRRNEPAEFGAWRTRHPYLYSIGFGIGATVAIIYCEFMCLIGRKQRNRYKPAATPKENQ